MKFIVYLVSSLAFAAVARAQESAIDVVARDTGGGTTLWELVRIGGWAMIPLAVMSIIMVMLVIAYTFTLRRGAVLSRNFMNTADVLLKKGDYAGLLSIAARHSETVARVVQRTVDFRLKNPRASMDTLREIAETEAAGRAASMQHRVVYLADIGVLAPMVGLFGTVIGIIRSFGAMGNPEQQASRDVLLAAGVSEALVATASGLILGIVAMAFYAYFRGRAQRLISDLDIATTHLLGLLAVREQSPKRRHDPAPVFEDEEEF